MGAIAVRDAIRVLDLTDQVLAAASLVAVQAVELRMRRKELTIDALSPELQSTFDRVRSLSPFLAEDRALEPELRAFTTALRDDARNAATHMQA